MTLKIEPYHRDEEFKKRIEAENKWVAKKLIQFQIIWRGWSGIGSSSREDLDLDMIHCPNIIVYWEKTGCLRRSRPRWRSSWRWTGWRWQRSKEGFWCTKKPKLMHFFSDWRRRSSPWRRRDWEYTSPPTPPEPTQVIFLLLLMWKDKTPIGESHSWCAIVHWTNEQCRYSQLTTIG